MHFAWQRHMSQTRKHVREQGCILEHQIFRSAKMILRDRCGTSYDLCLTFSWHAQYFRQMGWKNRKTQWYQAVSSERKQLSMFEASLIELLRSGPG